MNFIATIYRPLVLVVAAVAAYLQTQPDVSMPPYAKLVIGAIIVGLAVLDAPSATSNVPPPARVP